MKKAVLLFLVLLLILTLPACGRKSQTPSAPAEPEPETAVVPGEQNPQPAEETPAPAEKPAEDPAAPETVPDDAPAEEPEEPAEEPSGEPESDKPEASLPVPDEDGWYYDLENVTLYVMTYGKLPSNYITKKQAEALGWSGGSVQRFKEGAAIGGSHFGNYEGLLPDGKYTECDIDTDGASSRGAKRLIFSSDGHYYYTDDHYETFAEVTFVDGRMVLDYDY
ncbi:MAG: ribonuclease [Oscillospiraceae bacterium]|nr:ribonuclease [Oscillospiraceae bacterium]